MTFLLGPATVALAIPLYKNRQTFFKNLVPAGVGLLAGSLSTMIAACLIARIFRFTPELVSSIAVKSTTVPIAVEVIKIVQGTPTLTAIFGPWVMDRLAITHPVPRGLALGTVSHGQGTAQAGSQRERAVRCGRRSGHRARCGMHLPDRARDCYPSRSMSRPGVNSTDRASET